MMKTLIATVALLLTTAGLVVANEVELTGTYQVQVGCYGTYHEEVSFVVEPGKDKFSGIRHAVSMTSEQKKALRSGMTVKIRGSKHPAKTKKMTKGALRQAIYNYMKTSDGMPLHCKDVEVIVGKIAEQPADKAGAHSHGVLQLKAVEDDHELVDVTIMPHIAVDSAQIVSKGDAR